MVNYLPVYWCIKKQVLIIFEILLIFLRPEENTFNFWTGWSLKFSTLIPRSTKENRIKKSPNENENCTLLRLEEKKKKVLGPPKERSGKVPVPQVFTCYSNYQCSLPNTSESPLSQHIVGFHSLLWKFQVSNKWKTWVLLQIIASEGASRALFSQSFLPEHSSDPSCRDAGCSSCPGPWVIMMSTPFLLTYSGHSMNEK